MSRRGIYIETAHPCPPGKGINIEIDGRNAHQPGRFHLLEQGRSGIPGCSCRWHGSATAGLPESRIPGPAPGNRLGFQDGFSPDGIAHPVFDIFPEKHGKAAVQWFSSEFAGCASSQATASSASLGGGQLWRPTNVCRRHGEPWERSSPSELAHLLIVEVLQPRGPEPGHHDHVGGEKPFGQPGAAGDDPAQADGEHFPESARRPGPARKTGRVYAWSRQWPGGHGCRARPRASPSG